jgi:hypothetical protein
MLRLLDAFVCFFNSAFCLEYAGFALINVKRVTEKNIHIIIQNSWNSWNFNFIKTVTVRVKIRVKNSCWNGVTVG